MKKTRVSVQDIAEILVDKIDSINEMATRIELATSKKLEFDEKQMAIIKNSAEVMKKSETLIAKRHGAILDDLSNFRKKQQARLPNWVFTLLFGFFLLFSAGFYYIYNQGKAIDLLKDQNQFYKKELSKTLNELKKSK